MSDGPWSNTSTAFDMQGDGSPWRWQASEPRPYGTPQDQRYDDQHRDDQHRDEERTGAGGRPPYGDGGRPSFGQSSRPPFGDDRRPGRGFGDGAQPDADASDGQSPAPDPARSDPPRWEPGRPSGAVYEMREMRPFAGPGRPSGGESFPSAARSPHTPPPSPGADDERRGMLRGVDAVPTPDSAPPYPYEGDLDEAPRGAAHQRAAVPLERPSASFGPGSPSVMRPAASERGDWNTAESARHALEPGTPPEGFPHVGGEADQSGSGLAPPRGPEGYDALRSLRRGRFEEPGATYGTPAPQAGPSGGAGARALPQRVPAQPDVPAVPEPSASEPPAETPELARIATHLRRGDVFPAQDREEGFDVNAILAAVREVDGVRDASLRATPAGAHSLRLDLSEGADPAEVSRQVARLLQDRMGLDAAMKGAEGMPSAPLPPPAAGLPSLAGSSSAASSPPAPGLVPAQPEPSRPAPSGSARVPARPQPQPQQPPSPQPPARERPPEPALRPEPSAPPASGAYGRPGTLEESPAPEPRFPMSPAGSTETRQRTVGAPPVAEPPAPQDMVHGTAETVGEESVAPRPLDVGDQPGPRVVIENVQITTYGPEANVEVRLAAGRHEAVGEATGPAVDGYLLRLCAFATTRALDELLATSEHEDGPARCFVEQATVVPFGTTRVAVVVLLLSCGTWAEQLSGSAVVDGDDRQAAVRATLAAVNRRLEALLS
ncbi:Daple [Mangrovihabitans endophyticus]|nr:Daple [Mangrovihabitans endophyticus]